MRSRSLWAASNAISGEPAIPNAATTLRRRNRIRYGKSIQDYLAIGVNGQRWLDGVAVEPGKVRQFVAMPMGSGHSVEAQMTGEETTAGIQFEVTRIDVKEILENNVEKLLETGWPSGTVVMRLIAFSGDVTRVRAKLSTTIRALMLIYEHKKGVHVEDQLLKYEGQWLLEDGLTLADYNISNLSDVYIDYNYRIGFNPALAPKSPEMNIAAGGLIDRGIVQIPRYDYLKTVPLTFNVQILNSASFKHVTGEDPPDSTISAKTYAEAGYPFFSMYEEATTISGGFEGLKSVAQMDEVSEESMPTDMPVVKIGAVGLLNPRGSKQEQELEWEVRKRLGEMWTLF
ncbi:unnamed protein product [Fusarium equiseti]|uniref:Ubiquitin-like domain-containing protein n=1 Tax=Fusarium equiseti TaxID=61235 RepID=A0A8J2IRC4_FUSEQ|nr:unnamed protein product [Fusarium equiseti]